MGVSFLQYSESKVSLGRDMDLQFFLELLNRNDSKDLNNGNLVLEGNRLLKGCIDR